MKRDGRRLLRTLQPLYHRYDRSTTATAAHQEGPAFAKKTECPPLRDDAECAPFAEIRNAPPLCENPEAHLPSAIIRKPPPCEIPAFLASTKIWNFDLMQTSRDRDIPFLLQKGRIPDFRRRGSLNILPGRTGGGMVSGFFAKEASGFSHTREKSAARGARSRGPSGRSCA